MAGAAFVPEAMAFIAGIAYKLNRYSDMIEIVKKIAKEHFDLNPDQRKLLITAYKHTFAPKIKALRFIPVMEQGADGRKWMECLTFYREVLEDDMQAECRDALEIVENHLLPFCHDAENATLYNKMVGDVCWILAILKDEDKEPLIQKTLIAYETASKIAESLSPANPLRLGLHLTETAFYNDVMKCPTRAYYLAKKALDKAFPELHRLDEESHQKSTKVMGLIEKNLKKWTTSKGKETDTFMMPDFTFADLEETLTFKETWLETPSSSSTVCPCLVGAPSELDRLDEESHQESTKVMGLTEDYLIEWMNSKGKDDIVFVDFTGAWNFEDKENCCPKKPSSSSSGCPCPVVAPSVPAVVPDSFISPGDWGHDVHERLSESEIRRRKKAAQMKKGCMG